MTQTSTLALRHAGGSAAQHHYRPEFHASNDHLTSGPEKTGVLLLLHAHAVMRRLIIQRAQTRTRTVRRDSGPRAQEIPRALKALRSHTPPPAATAPPSVTRREPRAGAPIDGDVVLATRQRRRLARPISWPPLTTTPRALCFFCRSHPHGLMHASKQSKNTSVSKLIRTVLFLPQEEQKKKKRDRERE